MQSMPKEYRSPACSLGQLKRRSRGPAADVQIKRIHEPADSDDGRRVLVDRLWPRGISRARAALHEWRPELAPSTELRRWFNHDPERWSVFRRRYRAELGAQHSVIEELREEARHRRLTLLHGARDPSCNHARVLQELIAAAPVSKRSAPASKRAK